MKRPGFRRRARPETAPTTPERPAAAAAGSQEDAAGQPRSGQTAAKPARAPSVEERLDGLQGWAAQLERKLGIRTYAGAAALVLAIAAAAVALVLLLQLREDAATEDDVRELSEQISGVEDSATEAAQEDVQSVSERVGQLEQQLTNLESRRDSTDREISVLQDDIQDLRDQISELDSGPADGGAGAGGGSP